MPQSLVAALQAAGAEVTQVDPARQQVVCAHGRGWVTSLDVTDEQGKSRKTPCDLVAVAATPAPASDLPREHGVGVRFDEARGGFACQCQPSGNGGATNVAGVYVCGDVAGFLGVDGARASGRRVGEALAQTL